VAREKDKLLVGSHLFCAVHSRPHVAVVEIGAAQFPPSVPQENGQSLVDATTIVFRSGRRVFGACSHELRSNNASRVQQHGPRNYYKWYECPV
jgi:hypothetical protein